MSTARFGKKWADVDEDEEDTLADTGTAQTRFETPVDKDGIKTVIEYKERDGKTYKITRRIRTRIVQEWTNQSIKDRVNTPKFGKPKLEPEHEKTHIVRSVEEVAFEFTKSAGNQVIVKDDAEDKFHEESLKLSEEMTKQKKAWTDMNRDKQLERDAAGVRDPEDSKPGEGGDKPADTAVTTSAAPTSKYIPPSLRGAQGGKSGGKGADMAQQQEASLRITNLSEDCREGDLQDLFGQFGRLQRVFIAKDQVTFQSRGFAFVTYYNREDAQRAIDKLHGHGYDNLIMQVQFAKPRA